MVNKTKIILGSVIGVLTVSAAVGIYFVVKGSKKTPQPKAPISPKSDNKPVQDDSSNAPTTETPSDNTSATTVTPPVRTDFDTIYNYQKKDGIWYTAKKSAPNNWVSLADPKWQSAVDALNAKYPND